MTFLARRRFLSIGATAVGVGLATARTTSMKISSPGSQKDAPFRIGVNLAGAEFEAIGGRWKWPHLDNLAYYLKKGFTVFRIPFRWHRLQPKLRGPLLEEALAGLDVIIAAISSRGAIAILDSHDYGRRDNTVIGTDGSSVTAADFADFWGRMAMRYKALPLVWYNLMNEPHDMPGKANIDAQNAACAAIRGAGAKSKVLFSGIAWTGAHSWIKSGNGAIMLGAYDSANNYAFDVHQYLDQGFGGAGGKPVVPGVGSYILDAVRNWAETHGKKLFLGEFSSGPSKAFLIELDALLAYATTHRDVFIGATYFAGGGVWGHNAGSSDPINGVEKPQTAILEKYLGR